MNEPSDGSDDEFRSGFVAIVGRPNVGKSTLVNRIVGTKVSIVSSKPQTTRHQIRGIHSTSNSQIIFVDTPGLHEPRSALGTRVNEVAKAALNDVDVICLLIEAHGSIGPGDRRVAQIVQASAAPSILVVNKTDRATSSQVIARLGGSTGELGEFDAFVPLSARTGEGIPALLDEISQRLPQGPHYYPQGVLSDRPDLFMAAELVREKLLAMARDELPHSITVNVQALEDFETKPRKPGAPEIIGLLATVLVERPSQKGIVIGKAGSVLRDVGTQARVELEVLFGCQIYLEIKVAVERDWSRRIETLDRLGY